MHFIGCRCTFHLLGNAFEPIILCFQLEKDWIFVLNMTRSKQVMFKTKSATSPVLRSIGPLVPNLEELNTRAKTALVHYKITHSLNSHLDLLPVRGSDAVLKSLGRYWTLWYNFSSVANFWKKIRMLVMLLNKHCGQSAKELAWLVKTCIFVVSF